MAAADGAATLAALATITEIAVLCAVVCGALLVLASWVSRRHRTGAGPRVPLSVLPDEEAVGDRSSMGDQGEQVRTTPPRSAPGHLKSVLAVRRGAGRRASDLFAVMASHLGRASSYKQQVVLDPAVIQAAGKAGTDAAIARSLRHLEHEARLVDELQAREAELYTRASYRAGDRVRHPDGGWRPVSEVQHDEAALRAQIEDEAARGSRKHQQLPRWIGHIPVFVLPIDFALLFYFFSGITDVNWASPVSASTAFALLVAAMVTALSYGFLSFTGHRLRSYKDHSGGIAFGALDGLTRTACVASVADIVVLATLMFVRMQAQVLDALGSQAWGTALIIALALAVVSFLANFLVVAVTALNGSDEVDRLNTLSKVVSGPLSKAHQMQEEAAVIPSQIAVRRRRAYRTTVQTIAGAGLPATATDQAIATARAVYEGAERRSTTPGKPNRPERVGESEEPESAPQADLRALRAALDHLDTDLPET